MEPKKNYSAPLIIDRVTSYNSSTLRRLIPPLPPPAPPSIHLHHRVNLRSSSNKHKKRHRSVHGNPGNPRVPVRRGLQRPLSIRRGWRSGNGKAAAQRGRGPHAGKTWRARSSIHDFFQAAAPGEVLRYTREPLCVFCVAGMKWLSAHRIYGVEEGTGVRERCRGQGSDRGGGSQSLKVRRCGRTAVRATE